MSKKLIPFIAVMACAISIALCACASATFGLASSNDGKITITADNKATGEVTSTIDVDAGHGIRIFPAVEEGSITLTISDEEGRYAYSGTLDGASNPAYVSVKEGTFSILAKAEKADGSVEIGLYVLPDHEDEGGVSGEKGSASAAARSAGVGSFSVPIPISIAGRQIGSPKYYAEDDTASAVYSSRGLSVTISKTKGTKPGNEGDTTVECGDISVSCHGDGVYDALTWNSGDYSYSVKVDAEDDSMGITEDEVAFFVEKVS